MNRQAIWAIGLLVGAIAIAAAMILLRPTVEEQDPAPTVPLVQTASYTVSAGSLELFATGSVQPREEVILSAEVGGRLSEVNPAFREGSAVGRGAMLFRIDQSDYVNRVRSAQADVAAQEVAVLQAQEEMRIAQAELQLFAERQNTREVLAQAVDGNDYGARILPPEGMVSASRPPGGTQDTNTLATREPQLRSAEAARDRAAAQLADAELALSRTVVRAPFAGLIRSEDVAPGLLVQPGQALGSIVATDSYEVRVSLTEREAALIPSLFEAGGGRTPASVVLDYGGVSYEWSAHVDRADPILDPETRTIDVFLRVPNPLRGGRPVGGEGLGDAPPLLVGSFVQATIFAEAARPFAGVPIEALRTGDEIWLLRDGKLHIVPVEVMQRSDTIAYVVSQDLGEGGEVVISPLRAVVEGMNVRAEVASGEVASE